MNSEERSNDGVTLWSCPECAFTFDAAHTDTVGGGYSCPLCAEIDLESRLDAALARIAAVEADATYDDVYTEISLALGTDDSADEDVDFKRDLTAKILRHVVAVLAASPTPTGPEPEHDWDYHQPATTCRRCGWEYHSARWVNCPGPGPATPTEPTEETPNG